MLECPHEEPMEDSSMLKALMHKRSPKVFSLKVDTAKVGKSDDLRARTVV